MCAVRTNHKYYRLLLPDFVTGKLDGDQREELAAHLVPNSHIVPAGIVAVNRAQERGYSFSYTG